MEMWTAQLARWRDLNAANIEILDTTVKNAPGGPFSPTWDLVMGYKSGEFSEAFYREQYIERMRHSWRTNRDHWITTLTRPRYAILCFCPPGQFCHRLILSEIFMGLAKNLDIPLVNRGEFLKPCSTTETPCNTVGRP